MVKYNNLEQKFLDADYSITGYPEPHYQNAFMIWLLSILLYYSKANKESVLKNGQIQ